MKSNFSIHLLSVSGFVISTSNLCEARAVQGNNQNWNVIIEGWDAEQLFETMENAGLEKTEVNKEQRYVSELINCTSTRPSEFTLKEGCYFYQDGQLHKQVGFKPAFSMTHFMRHLGIPITTHPTVPVTEEYEIKNVTCGNGETRSGPYFYCQFTGKPGSFVYNQAETFYKLAEDAHVPSVSTDALTKVITIATATCKTKARPFVTSMECELKSESGTTITSYKPTNMDYINSAHWYMRKLGTTKDYLEGQDLTIAEASLSNLVCKEIKSPRGGAQYTCTYQK